MIKVDRKKELDLSDHVVPETTAQDLEALIPGLFNKKPLDSISLFKDMATGKLFLPHTNLLGNPKALVEINSSVSQLLTEISKQDNEYSALIKKELFLADSTQSAILMLYLAKRIGITALNQEIPMNRETCTLIIDFVIARLAVSKIRYDVGSAMVSTSVNATVNAATELSENWDGAALDKILMTLLRRSADFIFQQNDDFVDLKSRLIGILLIHDIPTKLGKIRFYQNEDPEFQGICNILKIAMTNSHTPIKFDLHWVFTQEIVANVNFGRYGYYWATDSVFQKHSIAELLGASPTKLKIVRWLWPRWRYAIKTHVSHSTVIKQTNFLFSWVMK